MKFATSCQRVLLPNLWNIRLQLRQPLQLLHDLNGLCQSPNCLCGNIHLHQVMVKLFEMPVQILVDNLGRQINPDVQNPVFIRLILETVL